MTARFVPASALVVALGVIDLSFSTGAHVVGGGVSKNSEKFLPYLELRTPVEIAALHRDIAWLHRPALPQLRRLSALADGWARRLRRSP